MKSQLILQLVNAFTEILHTHRLPNFCNWHIPYALIHLFTLSKGQILQQSFSNYLAHTDLFNFLLKEDLTFNFIKKEATIVMLILLRGRSVLYDERQQQIAEMEGSCFYLAYFGKGSYTVKLNAGDHKFLFLTLRAEWFIQSAEHLREFKTLTIHYLNKKPGYFALASCPLNKSILKPLKRTFSTRYANRNEYHLAINAFVSWLLERYQQMLVYRNYTTKTARSKKAVMISNFITENFTDQIVDDVHRLTKHFGVSEKGLRRLSAVAFGQPMRKQIIALRMGLAMQELKTTSKSIQEIAFDVGYNDARYFSRAFKKHYKCSPGDIRCSLK
ncbi:helix-turn-helix transcriptional regulator [Pedobacter nyackensis]|uniref:helix-turn-helix transcriptional regulator n=1 Tax=Pedobacter nyackensis TaxID=475255 RepID=UPI00292DD7B1|nr:helix-turn-helix transcriptional regulator [Pedobacter nyackensis]